MLPWFPLKNVDNTKNKIRRYSNRAKDQLIDVRTFKSWKLRDMAKSTTLNLNLHFQEEEKAP